MKKTLLLAVALVATITISAQTHTLRFEEMYSTILAGINASTETATIAGNKITLNGDRTSGIFTIISPSTRTARLDSCNATFVGHSINARIRLEPNGASNSTNGRKIYIECPAPGTLTVGCWTTTAARGYTVEDGNGTVISNANASMNAVTETTNLPLHTYNITTAGRVVLNPNAGFYYGFVEFVVGASGINKSFADKGISIKGNEVLNANNSKIEIYNVLGKKVLTSTGNVSFEKFEKGMYVVRTEGVKEALKFVR